MIQLVINTNMLREIELDKFLNAYARLIYFDEKDVTNDVKIKENLIELLDWDKNGDNGLGLYCSKFESIKRKDWNHLISIIKENASRIIQDSYVGKKKRVLESIKQVNDYIEQAQQKREERFENYKVSGRGKKAVPCEYNGTIYKSRQECVFKEKISYEKLYKYLKETGQL